MEYWESKPDVSIGQPVPKKVKIGLGIAGGLAVCGLIAGLIFRQQLVNYVVDPQILILDKTVNLEVGKKLDLTKYYKLEKPYVTVEADGKVNTNKLGSYDVVLTSNNGLRTKKQTVTIKVVDTTKPKLKLTTDVAIISPDKEFKAMDYVKDYSDNYDDKDELELDYTKNIDKNKQENTVIYSVKDVSGNETTKSLVVVFNEAIAPIVEDDEGNEKKVDKYLEGVHDVKVKKGTSLQNLVKQLIQGVSSSGMVSVDYSNVNLDRPAEYPVTFTSSDGLTKKCTVTVVE